MTRPFFIVGPTATGKSDIAAEVASACGGEIVGADAFQIYSRLDLLTAKPDRQTLAKVPHHLIGAVSPGEEMNAERFRALAMTAIASIANRSKMPFVVGGSGMYVKALTHGLSALPPADPKLRAELRASDVAALMERLRQLDAETARTIDNKNKQRVVRALEICMLAGKPASELRHRQPPASAPAGVLLFRDRAELNARIDSRVEAMFARGVVDEVRTVDSISKTAAKMLGFEAIRELIAGRVSESDCIAQIQQATRRYAKRQLTWFRGQTTFAPLNLSRYGHSEAIDLITRQARLASAVADD